MKSLVIAVLTLTFFFCKAQDNLRYHTSQLTPEEGLSQGSNYFRYEDQFGFMWLTANNALNRYDGTFCKVYNLDKYFKDCPPLTQGYGFAEDKEGNLYIGSIAGLYIYHRNTDRFTLVYPFGIGNEAMPIGWWENKIWCFNKNWEIVSFDPGTNQSRIAIKLDLPPLRSLHVYALQGLNFYQYMPVLDRRGKCWFFGTNANIAVYDIRKGQSLNPLKNFKQKPNRLYAAKPWGDSIFILSDAGLYTINTNNYSINFFSKKLSKLDWADMGVASDIIAFKSFEGIGIIGKDMKFRQWLYKPNKEYRRAFNLGFDKAGRLWFCNDGFGQIIFDFRKRLLPRKPDEKSGYPELKERGVAWFGELPDGNILLSQKLYNPFTETFTDFSLSDSRIPIKAASSSFYKGIFFSEEHFEKNKKKFLIKFLSKNKHIQQLCFITDSSRLEYVQDISLTPDQKLLIVLTHSLWLANPQNGLLQEIKNKPAGSGFKANWIDENKLVLTFIQSDSWLATYKNGLLRFEKNILPGIQTFYVSKTKNAFWCGTNRGVYLLDTNFTILKKFDANNGLAGTYIYGLLTDDEGNAWVSHGRGLSSISLKTGYTVNFGKEEGIQDYDFNNRSFLKSKDGTMYFGGIRGFNHFRPPLHTETDYRSILYIDQILVNDKDVPFNTYDFNKLTLEPGETNIAILVSVRNLVQAGKETIVYRLNNGSWAQMTTPVLLHFNNLAPGNYTLELGIKNRFIGNVEIQKTIDITIAKRFYQTGWFLILLLSLVFGGTLLIVEKVRESKRKREFKKLIEQQNQKEKIEEERNKFTADLHDEIGSALSSLQINSAVAGKLINQNSEKAKLVIEKVEEQSKQISEKIGDFIWSMKTEKDEFMTLNSRIRTFISDILGATEIYYTIELDESIQHLTTDFKFRKNILLLVKESVNNAVKYSNATEINITTKRNTHSVEICIKDNGCGIDPEKIKRGNGILNMKMRTAELGGVFKIESSPGRGTLIQALLPVP